MSFLKKLDTWLIEEFFTPIAWQIEVRWGKNSFWCAKITFGLSGVLSAVYYKIDSTPHILSLWACASFVVVAACAHFIGNSPYVVRQHLSLEIKNSVGMFAFRVIGISLWLLVVFSVLITMSLEGLVSLLEILTGVSAMYLLSCDQMPPSEKKRREADEKQKKRLLEHVGPLPA